jgi:hypothetical protein
MARKGVSPEESDPPIRMVQMFINRSGYYEHAKEHRILTIVAAALVWVSAAAGCSSGGRPTITSSQPAAGIVVTPRPPAAQPVPSPTAGGPAPPQSSQVIEGGQAATTPAIPAGADPHNPTTGMTN